MRRAQTTAATAVGRRLSGRIPRIALLIALTAALGAAQLGAQGDLVLNETKLGDEAVQLRAVLAGTDEEAYAQILTLVDIVQDPLPDTVAVYDIVVHYDPDRYSNARVGTYPLDFANQFIQWGRRVALHTQRTRWTSGRFYLRDISTAREAWILTEDARLLMGLMRKKLPGDDTRFLRFVHALPPYVDLRTMGSWLRLMHTEDRELANHRRQQEREAEQNSLLKDLQP